MISIAFSSSPASMAAIVFLTCVWIPLQQLKKSVGNMIGVISGGSYQPQKMEEPPFFPAKLPVSVFEELQSGEEREEICSICLVEFAGEDEVSQMQSCGHVYHIECIQNWLHRNHFTCPLCRSLLFIPL